MFISATTPRPCGAASEGTRRERRLSEAGLSVLGSTRRTAIMEQSRCEHLAAYSVHCGGDGGRELGYRGKLFGREYEGDTTGVIVSCSYLSETLSCRQRRSQV